MVKNSVVVGINSTFLLATYNSRLSILCLIHLQCNIDWRRKCNPKMRKKIVELTLILIFAISGYMAFDFGANNPYGNSNHVRDSEAGGAIAFGMIASASLIGFIYYECQNKKS
jgi:hypothetical protein